MGEFREYRSLTCNFFDADYYDFYDSRVVIKISVKKKGRGQKQKAYRFLGKPFPIKKS